MVWRGRWQSFASSIRREIEEARNYPSLAVLFSSGEAIHCRHCHHYPPLPTLTRKVREHLLSLQDRLLAPPPLTTQTNNIGNHLYILPLFIADCYLHSPKQIRYFSSFILVFVTISACQQFTTDPLATEKCAPQLVLSISCGLIRPPQWQPAIKFLFILIFLFIVIWHCCQCSIICVE